MSLEPDGSPKSWPPLGLPTGSVRALLTMAVIGVVVNSVVRGTKLDELWTETLLIALAHYYTARRFVALPPDVVKRLTNDGLLDQEAHPLYLPKHSIRILILAAFGGLGFWLYKQGRLWEPRALTLLMIVAAYVLGSIVRGIGSWFASKTGKRPSSRWGDLKAIVVLLAIAIAAATELMPDLANLPPEIDRIALAMLLFYFGSR